MLMIYQLVGVDLAFKLGRGARMIDTNDYFVYIRYEEIKRKMK